jgi:hypothetical protein
MTRPAILVAPQCSKGEFSDIESVLCDTASARRRQSRVGDYGSIEEDVKPPKLTRAGICRGSTECGI